MKANEKKENIRAEKEQCRERIIEMVSGIEDIWILRQIFRYIKHITE